MIKLIGRKITNGRKTARFDYDWDGEIGSFLNLYVGKLAIRLIHITKP